jgi:hypothetical protein
LGGGALGKPRARSEIAAARAIAPEIGTHRADLQELRAAELRRLQRQRCAKCVWSLGDRVLFELVDHIATRFGIEDEIDRLIERYAALDPVILRALGADRLPLPPIHRVGGRQ